MPTAIIDVAYGYIQVGPVTALVSSDRPANDPTEFASVHAGVLYIQAGTHTGQVELEVAVLEELADRRFGRAAWEEVTYPISERQLEVSSFYGLTDDFTIELPAWIAARIRVVSERYIEASESSVHGEPLDPLEHVLVEFAPARR